MQLKEIIESTARSTDPSIPEDAAIERVTKNVLGRMDPTTVSEALAEMSKSAEACGIIFSAGRGVVLSGNYSGLGQALVNCFQEQFIAPVVRAHRPAAAATAPAEAPSSLEDQVSALCREHGSSRVLSALGKAAASEEA